MNYGFEIACASVFTGFCIILATLYSQLNRAYTYWDKKKVNGPLTHYIVGSWSSFGQKFLGSEDYANVVKYGKLCGTYDGLTPNLLVTDPELIRDILNAASNAFQDIRFASESSVVLKDSLLALSGGEKQEAQVLMGSLLNPKKLEKLMPKLESSVETLIKIITEKRQGDGLVNITSSVKEFVEEVIALAIFGIELNYDAQFKEEFVKNIEQILRVKSPQSIRSLFAFCFEKYFKDPWICNEKVLQYIVNLIISGMSESSTELNTAEGKAPSLIDLMVEASAEEKELVQKNKEDGKPDLVLTDNVIISKCIASVLSLANATRTSVILGIYALSVNEEVQQKLCEEVKKNISEVISYEDLQQFNYLDKIVKEILRLYPFEFRLERVTADEVKLGEIELGKEVRVSIPLYALHRLEEYYSEPEKFDPERFSQSACEKRNPHTYLPFGQAGFNDSDISLQLAVLTTKLTLFRLIQKFKFSTLQKLGLNRLFQVGFTRVPQPQTIEVFAELRRI